MKSKSPSDSTMSDEEAQAEWNFQRPINPDPVTAIAKSAAVPRKGRERSAAVVTKPATEPTPTTPPSTANGWRNIAAEIPASDDPGSIPTKNESASESPPSKPSEKPPSASKKLWHTPKDVQSFAGQVNSVATKVLNGEIDMDIARAYASLARTVAQTISVEATRARFLKTVPNLALDEYDDES